MNRYNFLSFICFIVGIVFFVAGFLTGEIQGGLFVVFPFIVGSGLYALAGFIMTFLAILLFIFGFTSKIKTEENYTLGETGKKTSVKGGGVVLIGPIPIVFGSNWRIAIILMIISIILIITMFFLFRFL